MSKKAGAVELQASSNGRMSNEGSSFSLCPLPFALPSNGRNSQTSDPQGGKMCFHLLCWESMSPFWCSDLQFPFLKKKDCREVSLWIEVNRDLVSVRCKIITVRGLTTIPVWRWGIYWMWPGAFVLVKRVQVSFELTEYGQALIWKAYDRANTGYLSQLGHGDLACRPHLAHSWLGWSMGRMDLGFPESDYPGHKSSRSLEQLNKSPVNARWQTWFRYLLFLIFYHAYSLGFFFPCHQAI